MRTVAITINKGGAGKTMLSRSIATAGALAGFNVLVLDMDTQQNATTWGRRRTGPLPVVRFTTETDLPDELARAAAAGCDLAVIDTPPGRNTEAPAAVEAADLVLIPVSPEIEAYEGVPRTARLARTTDKPAFGILNFLTPNSLSEERTGRRVLETVGLPMAPAVLHRFAVHREASLKGMTAQELEPDSRAAQELAGLWNWLCAELQIGTGANVHKGTNAHVQKADA